MTGNLRKNSIILFISEGIGAAFLAATGLLTARFLRVPDYGRFMTAFSFSQILAVIVDSGTGQLVAKSIARERALGFYVLDQIFTWRVLMILTATLIGPPLCHLLYPGTGMWRVAAVLTPAMMLLMMADFFSWIFKGAQQVAWCAAVQIGSRSLLLGFCLCALRRRELMPILWAHMAAGVLTIFGGLWIVSRTLHGLRWVLLPKSFFREILPNIYKLGLIIVVTMIFLRADVMLVARVRGVAEAGLYGLATRVIDGLRLFPMVVFGIYLPLFVSLQDRTSDLRDQFKEAYVRLFIFSTLLSLGLSIFAGPVFLRFFGASYLPSAAYFRPLVWTSVFVFLNILMFTFHYAKNDHRILVLAIASAVVVELVLDVWLIPRHGTISASWARLAGECVNFAIQASVMIRMNMSSISDLLIRPAAMVGACLTCLALMSGHSLFIQWLAASSTFIVAALVFRFFLGPAAEVTSEGGQG